MPMIKVVYNSSHLLHDPEFELYDGRKSRYPETPDRIETIKTWLEQYGNVEIVNADHGLNKITASLHGSNYEEYFQQISKKADSTGLIPSNFIHDTYAPINSDTYKAARGAIDTALTGATLVASGEKLVYSLCRPPGHHAGGNYMGGYCYFNNAAAAANYLSLSGKVAILDIDYHHGNGTQNIFYERADVLYVSIHADPKLNYPYTNGYENENGRDAGLGYNFNLVVAKNCGIRSYMASLEKALKRIRSFKADYLVVSLGFDGYKDDPIAGFGFEKEDYALIAAAISGLMLPSLIVQEGGYCVEVLGELAQAFLKGWHEYF